jgi:hypothetical protein
MKRYITILLVSLTSLSGAAAQGPPPTFLGRPGDSASLYALKCDIHRQLSPDKTLDQNWCLGYIGGIASALRVTKKACIPDRKWGLDLDPDENDFPAVSYIKNHPEVASQPGEVIITNLLIKQWPCK